MVCLRIYSYHKSNNVPSVDAAPNDCGHTVCAFTVSSPFVLHALVAAPIAEAHASGGNNCRVKVALIAGAVGGRDSGLCSSPFERINRLLSYHSYYKSY
jgi:hypothetical protein